MHNKYFLYIIFSFLSIKNVFASPYCIHRVVQEKIELYFMTLPTDTCLTDEEIRRAKASSNNLLSRKSIEDICNEEYGLITKTNLIENLEKKEEPTIICSVNKGIFNGCITPYGGKVYYSTPLENPNNPSIGGKIYSFRVLGFQTKTGEVIMLGRQNSQTSRSGLNFFYTRPNGTWQGTCKTFERFFQINVLNVIPKELLLGEGGIKHRYVIYKKNIDGTLNPKPIYKYFGSMVQKYYEFGPNINNNNVDNDF